MLFWRPVYCSLVVAGVAHDRRWRKGVMIDNVGLEVCDNTAARCHQLLKPNLFLLRIFFGWQAHPAVEVRYRCQPQRPLECLELRRSIVVLIVVWRANDSRVQTG